MPSMSDLETRFLKFITGLEGAEDIDSLASEQQSQKADVFLSQRRIICEVKNLKTEVTPKIESFVAPLQERQEYPLFYGEMPLSTLLKKFPEKQKLKEKVYKIATDSTEDHIEKANRQIRETKKTFLLPDSVGLLVLLNDLIEELTPQILVDKIFRTLQRRLKSGRPLESIDCIWVISETHIVPVSDDTTGPLSIIVATGKEPHKESLSREVEQLQHAWSEFNGMPSVRTNDERRVLEKARPRTKKQNPTKITKQQQWEQEYRANRYMKSLPEREFLTMGASILNKNAQRFLTPSPPVTEDLMKLSHLFEEMRLREMDFRLLYKVARELFPNESRS